MSIRIMSQVWEHSTHAEGTLLVLLALADFSNDDGICFPSQTRLAKKSRLSTRQVKRILAVLKKSGELELVRPGRGRGVKAVYRVTSVKGDMASPFVKGDMGGKEKGTLATIKGDIAMSRQTVREPSLNHQRAQARAGRVPSSPSKTQAAWIRKQLKAELEEARNDLDSIRRPGGCAFPSNPTDPEKIARAAALVDRITRLKGELAKSA